MLFLYSQTFQPIILFKRPIILFVLHIIPNFDRMKQPITHILHECQCQTMSVVHKMQITTMQIMNMQRHR